MSKPDGSGPDAGHVRRGLVCWRWPPVAATRRRRPPRRPAPAGPPTIEVVKVVEQPLNVTLSLPGELNPYQTVALYARVTGFVKTIRVDRGSRVRAGEQIAVLEAPELGRAEGRGAVEAAERRGATRRRSDRRRKPTRARTTS